MANESSRERRDPREAGKRPPYPAQWQAPPGEERTMRPRPDYGRTSYVGLGRLKDRAAVVTGRDSGIGRATALSFAREGADVLIHYLDYAATKGAIVTFTKGLASELTPRGLRVNAVAPGPVWTPLIPQSFEPGHVAQQGTKAPLGRGAQPAEIAPAFVFLASDESRYVSGEILAVTGGTPLA